MIAVRCGMASTSLLLAMLLTSNAAASSQQGGGSPVPAKPIRNAAGSKTVPVAAAREAPSPFRITGRVINSLTRSPVGRAEVTVSPMGARRANVRFAGRANGQTAEAITDADGRFTLEVPSAGGWSLTVAAHGYHTQAFEEHDGFSTAIVLTEANPVYDVAFRLTPSAAIEGYVLDEAGEAVRNAQLTVSLIPSATPEDPHPRRQGRGNQRTDDRGYYKFSGLLSGNYDVRAQAQPWYATNGGGASRFGSGGVSGGIVAIAGGIGSGNAGGAGSGSESSGPDPLDVVYPVVWYPGVPDYSAATPITLHGGETKEADFHLLPIPGFHLRVAGNTTTAESDARVAGGNGLPGNGIRNNAYLSQVLPDGSETTVATPLRMDANGAMEFAGLAPGTYVVHQQGEADVASTATIKIAENSARTVDMSQAVAGVPVIVRVDADGDKPSLQVSFRDVESGHATFLQGQRDFGPGGQRRGRSFAGDAAAPAKDDHGPDRSINLPPGRYEVTLNGIGDLHLKSIEAKGATATGRTVTIVGGAPTLMLHVDSGRANVTGFVSSHGKPLEGAMVLLVPATLGDPAGLDVTRRDQSNTDGSFDITSVLPGAYILVAIDHGWDVNWSDPATLRRFLMHGLPLDLSIAGDRKETVEAQSP